MTRVNGNGAGVPERFPFLQNTATFSRMPGGWSYLDSGRIYKLDSDGRGPGASVCGMLETWLPSGRYAVRWADWSLKIERHEVAALLAQADADLERVIRNDLFAFRMAITMTRLEAAAPPDELLIRGLDPAGMRTVTRVAQRLGAQIYRRGA